MPRSLLKLFIFTLLFVTNIYATTQTNSTGQSEINSIKTEIEKIKLTQHYENRDDKLKDIENNIKDLEDRLNKEIDKGISAQDKRISDLNFYLTLYGAIITMLLLIASWGSYKFSSNETSLTIKKWLDEKAEKEFQPKVNAYLQQLQDKGHYLLEQIKSEATEQNHKHAEDFNKKIEEFDLKLENLSPQQKEKVDTDVKKLGDDESKYRFNDWYTKFLQQFFKNSFEEALEYINKALGVAKEDREIAQALYAKGMTLGVLGKSKESIEVYDKAIEKFSESKNEVLLKQVANALANKIEILVITNQDISKDLEVAKKLFSNDENEMIKYSMLEILYNSKNSDQDEQIKEWMKKYKDISLNDWHFRELDAWNESMEGEVVKLRVKKYIDIFKTK